MSAEWNNKCFLLASKLSFWNSFAIQTNNSSQIGTENNSLNSQKKVNVSPINNSSTAGTSYRQLLTPGRIVLQKTVPKRNVIVKVMLKAKEI